MTAEDTIERYATARYVVKEAREAKWARRIAVFFLQLLILTALLHRFFDLSTPAAISMLNSRKIAARPEMMRGRSGRIILMAKATIAGSAKAHATHIAASRRKSACGSSRSGKSFAAGS